MMLYCLLCRMNLFVGFLEMSSCIELVMVLVERFRFVVVLWLIEMLSCGFLKCRFELMLIRLGMFCICVSIVLMVVWNLLRFVEELCRMILMLDWLLLLLSEGGLMGKIIVLGIVMNLGKRLVMIFCCVCLCLF